MINPRQEVRSVMKIDLLGVVDVPQGRLCPHDLGVMGAMHRETLNTKLTFSQPRISRVLFLPD